MRTMTRTKTIGTDSGSGPTRQIPGELPLPEREREGAHRWHLLMYKQHNLHNVSYKTPALPV